MCVDYSFERDSERFAEYSAQTARIVHDDNDVHIRIYIERATRADIESSSVVVCEIHEHDFDAKLIETHRQLQNLYNDIFEELSSESANHDFVVNELTFEHAVLKYSEAMRELAKLDK